MEVHAVCFDLDGTLIDSEPVHLRVWNEVLKPYGIAVTVDEFKHRYVGTVTPEMADELVRNLGIKADPAGLAAEKDAKYIEWVRRKPVPTMPYARESVTAFARRGMKMACVTGSPREITTLNLKRLGILNDFSVVVARDDVSRSKPDPECYLKAMKDLGESADTTISFEDSEAGVLSATGAGMICFAVKRESSDGGDLSAAAGIFNGLREATRWVIEHYPFPC